MKVTVKIKRYLPERQSEPFFQHFTVAAEPTDRVLDVLMKIKETLDGSLAFRKSCAHGVCGSDAMRINGKDGLACKTLVRDVGVNEGKEIVIEPLAHFRVQKDLIVDQGEFFQKYKSISPFLINDIHVEEKERLQSPEDREKYDDPTNCILCGACFSACPILDANPDFLGPAMIAQAARFNDDSRDFGFETRLPVLDHANGVWPCNNHFACTRACPRSIKITKLINQTKRAIETHKRDAPERGA